ncbi:hypothetical protein [Nocardia cyriacigeorgica]|uniref:Uncharacterized protein n=1 Tax=Nocardia cyriacigeorgica TaxID=135487 RepID=A0A5R8N8T6_9NOCA|nr:hypothetical protein [Nocardia cyriacigeorgica]TLF72102.1 hypothetical protein FEK34_29625 [Nocardia cyriacigeorgica]
MGVSGVERGLRAGVAWGVRLGSCVGVRGCAAELQGWCVVGVQGYVAGVPMVWWGSGVRESVGGWPGGGSGWIRGRG